MLSFIAIVRSSELGASAGRCLVSLESTARPYFDRLLRHEFQEAPDYDVRSFRGLMSASNS